MILDPYSGPRGWSVGLRMLGLNDIGIEWDAAACATAAAAGFRTIRADVARFPLDHLAGRVDGLIMSPPCQAFSTAGKGEGRAALAELAAAIRAGDWTGPAHDDDRIRHVLEVGRWAETLRPTWIACEQVPPVLPLWATYAERWRHLYGWSTWAGILNAADYGVPQTRRRAFLIARTDGRPVGPPPPTHARGGEVTLFGELLPWVSMAEALGWTDDVTVEHQRGRGMAERHGERPVRPATEPAPSVTAGANRRLVIDRHPETYCTECATYDPRGDDPGPWHSRFCSMWEDHGGRVLDRRQQSDGVPVRLVDCDTEPAPTLTGIAGAKSQWVFHRPATTLVGDGRAFGPHAGSKGEPHSSNTIRLTIRDALTLQGFPPDYPVQGTKTKQFEQIGNACPPPLAAHVLSAATGIPLASSEVAA